MKLFTFSVSGVEEYFDIKACNFHTAMCRLGNMAQKHFGYKFNRAGRYNFTFQLQVVRNIPKIKQPTNPEVRI